MNYWHLLIPLLSAFIGWVTIRIATWLLFRPLQPKRWFGLSVQGALPANHEKIAAEAGKYAAALFTPATLQQKVGQTSGFDEIRPLIEDHMDHFLRHKLQEQMPMIAMFIGDKTIQQLKAIFIQEIELLFPEVIARFTTNMAGQINISELVTQKISALSPERIEAAFKQQLDPSLKKAGALGMMTGLIIGLVQLLIVLLL